LLHGVQCPFSKKAYAKLKEVVAHYGKDKLDLVFINWIQLWHPGCTRPCSTWLLVRQSVSPDDALAAAAAMDNMAAVAAIVTGRAR
jgi:hypothetical protein